MFTIEHEFDATVIVLIDEEGPDLREDVTIHGFEDCVTLEQFNSVTGQVERVELSMSMLRDLSAALNLPEGVYRLRPRTPDPHGS